MIAAPPETAPMNLWIR